MMNTMTAEDIEIALSEHFHTRRNFVIPNVSWGFRNLSYEVDVMVITTALYAYDIEIKVSPGDLKRDAKKHKWNYCQSSNNFRESYFAMPANMAEKYLGFVPKHAGILAVAYDEKRFYYTVTEIRKPTVNTTAKKVTESELAQLGRLTMMRMWTLKRNLRTIKKQNSKKILLTLDEEEG